MNSQILRVSILVLVSACAACSGKKDDTGTTNAAQDQATAGASSQGVQVASPEANNGDLDALVDLVVAESADLPRAEFDAAALAGKLGKNPQANFEWVRDHTWWAPYRGLLRGSQGMMLDRVGSNLDRAVLLGDLLRLSGHDVRLAHAELTESRARELLDKLSQNPDRRIRKRPLERLSNERKGASEKLMPGLDELLRKESIESKKIVEQAGALINSQASELYAALKDSAGKTDGREERAAISAMRDYWWVEHQENGKWVAMDLLAPVAQMGSLSAATSTTSVWKASEALPEVPEADLHSVKFRVVIERYADGATTESTVLETVLLPAELLERPISLTHMPKPWPATLLDTATDPNAIGNAAVNVKEWVPVLQVGDALFAQSGFTDSGDLIADPLNAKRDIGTTGGAGFMSGFGEALGGSETASSSLTAEWLDYQIHVPGEKVRRLRRPVFDLLGPARRSAKVAEFDASTNERLVERYQSLLSTTQILLQASDLTAEFFVHLATKSILANQAAFRELSKERDTTKAKELAYKILDRMDNWGPLPNLALWRSELDESSRASFIDRPNVLNWRIGIPAVNADRLAYRELIDVVSNSTSVKWGAGRDPFEVRLRQGVADTVAEIVALGGNFRMADNTASVFAMAGAAPDRGKLVGARDVDAVQGLEWPDDASARLIQDIDAGFMAVVLHKPISLDQRQRVGWWRVDPASGETIGVMDTGFHGAMDERVEMELAIMQLRNSLRNWLSNNGSRIAQARARSRVPWNAAQRGDAELLRTTDRVLDVLRQAAEAGF